MEIRLLILEIEFRVKKILYKIIKKILGKKYRPTVFIPHPLTVRQFRQYLKVGEKVLDMGTGSGVLAKIAFIKGAKEVVAADINPVAVEKVKKLLPKACVLVSDLFENIKGVYDTIIFNAPWIDGKIHKPYDYGMFDSDRLIERFFMGVKNHLAKNGYLWLQYADAIPAKFDKLHSLIKENGLTINESWFHERWGPIVKHNIRVFLYKISVDDDNGKVNR